MKVLITGGNGYIARSLYAALSDSHEVMSVTRADFDLRNYTETAMWFAEKHFDVIIHTAIVGGSRLISDTIDVLDSNLRMYYNLLDNKQHFNKFINIGSGAEIYQSHTPYGLSKHTIRRSLLEKDNFYNVRVFGVFDKNELGSRFIKSNIMRYINKESLIILENKQMDFFFMEDFIRVVKFYIETANPPKELDCTYETSPHLKEIAEHINSLSDYNVPIDIQSQEDAQSYVGQHTPLPINYTGMLMGITRVYKDLACKI